MKIFFLPNTGIKTSRENYENSAVKINFKFFKKLEFIKIFVNDSEFIFKKFFTINRKKCTTFKISKISFTTIQKNYCEFTFQ